MRCLTPFIAIALLALFALVGYNTWQIGQLRHQLAVQPPAEKTRQQVSAEKEINNLLDEARQQTERARKMISGGQVARARTELNESLQKLEKASRLSKDMADGAARSIGGTVENIKSKIGGLSGQEEKRRPESNENKSRE